MALVVTTLRTPARASVPADRERRLALPCLLLKRPGRKRSAPARPPLTVPPGGSSGEVPSLGLGLGLGLGPQGRGPVEARVVRRWSRP